MTDPQVNDRATPTGLPEVWIVTGMSGAGKTNAIRIFEDWGYLCIDNLPPAMLTEAVSMAGADQSVKNLALGVDVRSGIMFEQLMPVLDELSASESRPRILFLDADTPTLVNRFKETRRRHPMASTGSLVDTIQAERARLEPMRANADVIIDTSKLTVKEFRETMEQRIYVGRPEEQLRVHVVSFGYKYGIPMDADLLMDVRFLPNPHYTPELRPLTGKAEPVRDYVMGHEASQVFFKKFSELLFDLIPNYIEEGKSALVVAIGCTGGRHRSVTLAEELHSALTQRGFSSEIRHRDIER